MVSWNLKQVKPLSELRFFCLCPFSALTNCLNLIIGLDGLADVASLSTGSLGCFAVYRPSGELCAFELLCFLDGSLHFCFNWYPAKIFQWVILGSPTLGLYLEPYLLAFMEKMQPLSDGGLEVLNQSFAESHWWSSHIWHGLALFTRRNKMREAKPKDSATKAT